MEPDTLLSDLNETLNQCRKSTFYRDRLPAGALGSLSALKEIPLTTKKDVQRHSPHGFLCVPNSELCQYHETFGTTGDPASTWLTREDLLDHGTRINEWGINFTPEDRVLIRFPYAISTIAHYTHVAAQLKGACVIPASSRNTITPFPRVVQLLRKLEVTVLAALPLQAMLIAETAELLGFDPRGDFTSLRAVYTAGEAMTTGRRRLIQNIWGVPVIDNYGMTEVGAMILDCEHGIPHPLHNRFVFEVLDENLLREVSPGEIGNLVVTTLRSRATPLMRYLTEDRARFVKVDCPCGRPVSMEIKGRKQHSLMIGHREFDIWALEDMVSRVPFCKFWVAGPYRGGLKFVLEQVKPGDSPGQDLKAELEEEYEVAITFEVIQKGQLFDRDDLLAVGPVGKPRYVYSEEELDRKAYVRSRML